MQVIVKTKHFVEKILEIRLFPLFLLFEQKENRLCKIM